MRKQNKIFRKSFHLKALFPNFDGGGVKNKLAMGRVIRKNGFWLLTNRLLGRFTSSNFGSQILSCGPTLYSITNAVCLFVRLSVTLLEMAIPMWDVDGNGLWRYDIDVMAYTFLIYMIASIAYPKLEKGQTTVLQLVIHTITQLCVAHAPGTSCSCRQHISWQQSKRSWADIVYDIVV